MWDTVQTNGTHLLRDLPCPRCGHEVHTFLACGDDCACEPVVMPGSVRLAACQAYVSPRRRPATW
jgi:hypothetical protein